VRRRRPASSTTPTKPVAKHQPRDPSRAFSAGAAVVIQLAGHLLQVLRRFHRQDQVVCGLNGRGEDLLINSIWARCPRRQRMGLDDGIASPWRDESANPTEAAAWRCRSALITPTMS
jgi:hypothetical protein